MHYELIFRFGEPFPSVLIVNYDIGKMEQFLLKSYHFPSFYSMLCLYFVYTPSILRVYSVFTARKNRTICVCVVGAKLVFFPERCKFFGMNFQLQFYFIFNKITMDCKVGIAKREFFREKQHFCLNIYNYFGFIVYLCRRNSK